MQFPNQMNNFQNSLQEKIVTLSPQNNQPFVFTPQTNMFANLNIQATNLNNAFLTPLNRLNPSSTVDSNIPNVNRNKNKYKIIEILLFKIKIDHPMMTSQND